MAIENPFPSLQQCSATRTWPYPYGSVVLAPDCIALFPGVTFIEKSNSIVNFISHQRLYDPNFEPNYQLSIWRHSSQMFINHFTSSAAFIYQSTSYSIHAFSKFKIIKHKKNDWIFSIKVFSDHVCAQNAFLVRRL